jgi:hypothetical protein
MARTKRQHLKITVIDRRGEEPTESTKTYTDHQRFLRDIGKISKIDAHYVETTETTIEIYATEDQTELFD